MGRGSGTFRRRMHKIGHNPVDREVTGMEETPMLTTLKAKILRVCCCDLLVCDVCTCQEILVHTPRACCFSVGECVCIEYSGAMTMSIPPQITATDIRRVCGCC